MNITEMKLALEQARETIRNADVVVKEYAWLLKGRLRTSGVSGMVLTALKKELRDWDIHRGRWIDREGGK